jgi:hypothetical protein
VGYKLCQRGNYRQLIDFEYDGTFSSFLFLGLRSPKKGETRRERKNPEFYVEYTLLTQGVMLWGTECHVIRSHMIFISGNAKAAIYVTYVLQHSILPYLQGCYQWRIVHCKSTDAFIIICNIKDMKKVNKNKRSKFIIKKKTIST